MADNNQKANEVGAPVNGALDTRTKVRRRRRCACAASPSMVRGSLRRPRAAFSESVAARKLKVLGQCGTLADSRTARVPFREPAVLYVRESLPLRPLGALDG